MRKKARQMQSRTDEMEVAEFVEKRLGIELDEIQVPLLRAEAKQVMVNCCRQWGKSTIAAAKAVHRAYTGKDRTVLVVSPCLRQSAELLRKAAYRMGKLGLPVRGDGDNQCSLLFPNGSRIVGLPGTEGTVRGFSAVSLIVMDEASKMNDSTYKAMRPMLAVSQGDLWLMSTPFGKQGFFYETWANGDEDWLRVSVKATECPRIPANFLEKERRGIGDAWFRQEYMCEFVDNGVGMFDRGLLEEALEDGVKRLDVPRFRSVEEEGLR